MLVAGIEEDAEERVAKPPRDDLVQRAAGLPDRAAPRTTRRSPRNTARRAARRSRRSPAGSSVASSTTKPARQSSAPQTPNAVVNAVAALDPPVAGAQQAEGRPWPGRQHQVAGQRHAVPVEQPDGLALGHPGPKPEQQPADAVRRLAGRVFERRQLLDLVDAPAARRPASMSRSVAFSTSPSGPSSARSSSTRNAGTSIARSVGVRLPADDADPRCPGRCPRRPRISASGRERSRGWPGRLRSWNRTRRIGSGAAPAMPQHSLPTRIAGSPRRARRSASASSKRGSKPRQPRRGSRCARGRRR